MALIEPRELGAPLPAKWKSDDDLIWYCYFHSSSELALFHKEDVDRMLTLAGYPDKQCGREWVSMHESMRELCDLARQRIREEQERAERQRREDSYLAALDHFMENYDAEADR